MSTAIEPGKPVPRHPADADWSHPNDHPARRFILANRASLGSLAAERPTVRRCGKLRRAPCFGGFAQARWSGFRRAASRWASPAAAGCPTPSTFCRSRRHFSQVRPSGARWRQRPPRSMINAPAGKGAAVASLLSSVRV